MEWRCPFVKFKKKIRKNSTLHEPISLRLDEKNSKDLYTIITKSKSVFFNLFGKITSKLDSSHVGLLPFSLGSLSGLVIEVLTRAGALPRAPAASLPFPPDVDWNRRLATSFCHSALALHCHLATSIATSNEYVLLPTTFMSLQTSSAIALKCNVVSLLV